MEDPRDREPPSAEDLAVVSSTYPTCTCGARRDAPEILWAAAGLVAALDRNTEELFRINETLNLIREDRLREGT